MRSKENVHAQERTCRRAFELLHFVHAGQKMSVWSSSIFGVSCKNQLVQFETHERSTSVGFHFECVTPVVVYFGQFSTSPDTERRSVHKEIVVETST